MRACGKVSANLAPAVLASGQESEAARMKRRLSKSLARHQRMPPVRASRISQSPIATMISEAEKRTPHGRPILRLELVQSFVKPVPTVGDNQFPQSKYPPALPHMR